MRNGGGSPQNSPTSSTTSDGCVALQPPYLYVCSLSNSVNLSSSLGFSFPHVSAHFPFLPTHLQLPCSWPILLVQ
jgi:hypothetical protein